MQTSLTRFISAGVILFTVVSAHGQGQRGAPPTPTIGMDSGLKKLATKDFNLFVVNESGIATTLAPTSTKDFDFLPIDRLNQRSGDGSVHLGDISLRVRAEGESDWKRFATYTKRAKVNPVSATYSARTDDVTPSLGSESPVRIQRTWSTTRDRLRLSFTVTNTSGKIVEIGGLGVPMPFNNIIMNRSLPEAHAKCSFTDPYIGGGAGYLQVTRLDGVGPTMVVTPVGNTPFESWRLVNEPLRTNQVFEGMMEWTVHTKSFADSEWKGVEPWVEPSSALLKPKQSQTYGFEFTLVPSLRDIESTLEKLGRPVAAGVPGYILPMDLSARLFLKYGKTVRGMKVSPVGALELATNREGRNGWRGYSVRGKKWGRARLTITYADGTDQVVSYYVTKPASDAVADMGRFLTTKAWFNDANDPFKRGPSPISYDREEDKPVVQDSRVWIAGLGDEGGSGNWLALGMKLFGQPNPSEIAKYEDFIDGVLWGNLQFKEGPNAYGVRKSTFFYEPALVGSYEYRKDFNWTSWTSWNKRATDDIGRGYNYPHVVAAYWSMYRVARNHPDLVKKHKWDWYLNQAFKTIEFMTSQNERGRDRVGYWRLGLMDGTVFQNALEDLKREGWSDQAKLVEDRMRLRADRWKNEAFPFGSEMPWDSTGQEEVYAWTKYFGYEDKAKVTLNAILAYDPTVPHWGYNGNARRYWDFIYGGKLRRIERQIHHYGSGLNAIPLLSEYREHPEDLYLLRVGYGGTMGAISNIDQEGFASAAFHSFPDMLKWDAYSGDYGPNFFGHAQNVATYLVETPNWGWQSFGGEVSTDNGIITVTPKDSFRKRVYIAPAGLYVTLDAGQFESVTYDPKSKRVKVKLAPKDSATATARLVLETPIKSAKTYAPVSNSPKDAGAYTFALGSNATTVELVPG